MASNALLMHIVVKSVHCAGLFELMPYKTCCMRLVVQCLWNVMVKTRVEWMQWGHQDGYVQYNAFCDFGYHAE